MTTGGPLLYRRDSRRRGGLQHWSAHLNVNITDATSLPELYLELNARSGSVAAGPPLYYAVTEAWLRTSSETQGPAAWTLRMQSGDWEGVPPYPPRWFSLHEPSGVPWVHGAVTTYYYYYSMLVPWYLGRPVARTAGRIECGATSLIALSKPVALYVHVGGLVHDEPFDVSRLSL